jgi:serine/threonine protein kinase
MIGRMISHYKLVELLGRGGMGVVYKAEDTKVGRPVALKFLSADFAEDDAALKRFRREARTASGLNHPNICRIYEVGTVLAGSWEGSEFEGFPFLAMEWLEGETLRDRMIGKPFPAETLLRYAMQITEGLDAAHSRGIIHRDITPSNLFITNEGTIKILDFGLAMIIPTESAGSQQVTVTSPGIVVGTVQYMSPEQVRGKPLDHRTDLFSLGVVLYEMATGTQPFHGETAPELVQSILQKDPVPLEEQTPDVLPGFAPIVAKLMAKDREERTESAEEVLRDLQSLRPMERGDSTEVRVVGICGSLRDNSHTTHAVRIALEGAKEYRVETQLIELKDYDLCFCDGRDDETTYPDDVFKLRTQVRRAQGIIIGTPEYHGGYSGVLKNALDLMGFEEFEGKVIGLVGVSGGSMGAVDALNSLRAIGRALHAWVVPVQGSVPEAWKAFDDDGEPKDPALDKKLRDVGRKVARFAFLHTSEEVKEFVRLWEGAPQNPGG